jgi:hypothetical protein
VSPRCSSSLQFRARSPSPPLPRSLTRPHFRPRRPGCSVDFIRLRWQGDRIVPKGLARGRQGAHLEDVCRSPGLVQGARLIRRHVPLSWNAKSSDLSLRLYTSIDYSSDNSVSVPMFPDRAIRLDDNKDLAGTKKIGHVPLWLRSTWSSPAVASPRSS